MKTRDSKGQNERWRGTNCVPHISVSFSERVLLFFFLLVCEILSPVCPPKISFKNFPIDTQRFTQYKYRLRGQINILHRQVSGDYQRLAYIINDYQGVHFERLSF